MGIVNCTPDSFSDGGAYATATDAIDQGVQMLTAGASIIDVGGESTRPGSDRVSVEEEIERVHPVIAGLSRHLSSPLLSVDTMKAKVAAAAIQAGAQVVNDVSAGRADPELLSVVKDTGAGLILMHMQGDPKTMQERPVYTDVVGEVRDFLLERAGHCESIGIRRSSLVLDPGIGFGKTTAHNLELLANLTSFVELGYPVLVGASRKRFIGALTGREVHDRLGGSLAVVALAVAAGVQLIRVHDVQESCDLVRVMDMISRKKGCHVMDQPTSG